MDAAELVRRLSQHEALTALLSRDPHNGEAAIYQIQASEPDALPRLAIFESDRQYTRYADDFPIEERVQYTIDLYAKKNILREMNAALHAAMRQEGFQRTDEGSDEYLPDEKLYAKTVAYAVTLELPMEV